MICNFYLSVAACKLVWADPSLRYTSMFRDVKQPSNKQQFKDSNQQLCGSLGPLRGRVQCNRKNRLSGINYPHPQLLHQAFIPRKTTPVATVPMKLKLFSGNEHSPHAGPKDFSPERDTASFLVCGNGFPWFLVSSSC